MSRDSILGWILTVLVVISLFLSFSIWSQVPGNFSAFKISHDDNKVDPIQTVGPDKILVYFGNSFSTLLKPSAPLFEKSWSIARELLRAGSNLSPEPIGNISRENYKRTKGMEVFFPTPLPANFLKQLFNIEAGDFSSLDGKFINSFLLLDEGELSVYLVDTEDLLYKIGKGSKTQDLNVIIRQIDKSDPPLYANLTADVNIKVVGDVYVSLSPYELPVYALKREQTSEEQIATKFFPDFSITRRIQERDGTVIYTDGQQGLRFYDDGSFEYNIPVSRDARKTQGFYESFITAIDFIAGHGGFPADAYLASYEESSGPSGQTFVFKFRISANGFKIINTDDFINITVEGGQVKNYYRNPSFSTKQIGILDLMTPVEALNTAVSTKNIKVVSDVHPAYVVEDEELKPVWVVETSGMEVIIHSLSE
ncbi:MAG: two-component system activity regulator YycH [Tepidanaerobacteraceae bacterium]